MLLQWVSLANRCAMLRGAKIIISPFHCMKSGFSNVRVVRSKVNQIMMITLTYFSTPREHWKDKFLNTEIPCCFPLRSCNRSPVVFARLPKCAQLHSIIKKPPRQNNYNCNPTRLVHLQQRLLKLKNSTIHSKSNNLIWRVAPYSAHSAKHSALPKVKRPIQLLMVALIGWQNLHQPCLTERYTAQARQSAQRRSSSPGCLGKASGVWSNAVTNKKQNKSLVVSKWKNSMYNHYSRL